MLLWGDRMQNNEPASSVGRLNLVAPSWLVVIGAGTGGPQALEKIIPQLPEDFPGTVVIVQQMRPGFTRVVAEQLNYSSRISVAEPVDGQALQASRVLVTPGNAALTFGNAGASLNPGLSIFLEDIAKDPEKYRNRTNDAMISAARVFGYKTIGVLLTGLGDDGREGMRAVAEAGGVTIAQDEASSVVFDLPSSAIEAKVVQHVLPLWSIADRITQIAGGTAHASAA